MRALSVSVAKIAFPMLALAALVVSAVACGTEEGATPTCTQDVSAKGNSKKKDGCNPYAKCVVDGKDQPASVCCKGLKGTDLTQCLYGFGAASLTTTSAASGGGSGGGDGSGGAGGS